MFQNVISFYDVIPYVNVMLCLKLVQWNEFLFRIVDTDGLWPLLLTWINFNPNMDK